MGAAARLGEGRGNICYVDYIVIASTAISHLIAELSVLVPRSGAD